MEKLSHGKTAILAPVVAILAAGGCATSPSHEPNLATLQMHRDAFVMDLHTDTLLLVEALGYDFGRQHWPPLGFMPWMGHVDLPRARQGGMDAMFMGVVANPLWGDGAAQISQTLRVAHEQVLDKYPDQIELAWSADDLTAIAGRGKIAVQFLIEGAHGMGKDLSRLEEFYRMGVRAIGLAHFTSNDYAASSADENTKRPGLSLIGRELVQKMNAMGIAVDLAHVHPQSFREAIALTTAPVIVSHTGVAAQKKVFRNLSDDQIRAVAATGGVVGVMYATYWLSNDLHPPMDIIVTAMKHVRSLVGAQHIALGSDYDGFILLPRGMKDVRDQPKLTQALLDGGFTPDEVRGILGGNIMRVLREVERRATARPLPIEMAH